jgi:hypothetical protein
MNGLDPEQMEIVRALQSGEFDALLDSTRRGVKAALKRPNAPFIQEMFADLDKVLSNQTLAELIRAGNEDAMWAMGFAMKWVRRHGASPN